MGAVFNGSGPAAAVDPKWIALLGILQMCSRKGRASSAALPGAAAPAMGRRRDGAHQKEDGGMAAEWWLL